MTEQRKTTISDDIELSYGSSPPCNFVDTVPKETVIDDKTDKLDKAFGKRQKRQDLYRRMYEQLTVLTFVYAYKCRKVLYYIREERGRRTYPDTIFDTMFNIQDMATGEITLYRDIVTAGFSDIVSDLIIEYKATYDNKPYNRAKLVNYYILKRLHMRDVKYRFRIRYLPFVWVDMDKVFMTKLNMDLDYDSVRSNIRAILQSAIVTETCSSFDRVKHVKIPYSTLEKVFTRDKIGAEDIVFEPCSDLNTAAQIRHKSEEAHEKDSSNSSGVRAEERGASNDKSSSTDKPEDEYIDIHSDESSTETEDCSNTTLHPDAAFPKPATDVSSTVDRRMIEDEMPDEQMTLSIRSSRGIGEVAYTITRQSLLNLFANPHVSIEDSTITIYSDDDVRSALAAHRACK